jgi:hypothetical protein
MSVRPCPNCLYPAARYLEGPSADAHVRYYRCEPCGHVFVVPNENPDGPPRTIAPGKKPPNGRPLALPVSARLSLTPVTTAPAIASRRRRATRSATGAMHWLAQV